MDAGQQQPPHDVPPQNGGGQQQPPPPMMMYAPPPPPGNEQQPQNPTDPSQQQQQQPQAYAYPPAGMAFAPPPQMQFFAQPYPPQPGMEQQQQQQPQYFAPQPYPQPPQQPGQAPDQQQQGQQQQDYMNANQYLMARLQQAPWGYGMPMTTPEGYTVMAAPPPPEGMMMMGPWSTTSAGLLGKIGGPEPKKKSIRKKHKDKPKRPLSAYNLFFKDERKNILESVRKSQAGEDEQDQEGEDGAAAAKKKTPQGKIGFENLAKIIGQRWQKLEPDRIEHYKKLAAVDMKRYKAAMEVFLAKIEKEKKEKYEMEVGHVGGGQVSAVEKEEEEGDDEKPAAAEQETKEEETETKQV